MREALELLRAITWPDGNSAETVQLPLDSLGPLLPKVTGGCGRGCLVRISYSRLAKLH
jgi:hypothetical protein